MSSVSPPNKSDIRRTAVDSDSKQPGGGTEGTVDRLNEAPRWYSPDEVASYLQNNFDVYASDEMVNWIADGYQRAFDKGNQLGKASTQS